MKIEITPVIVVPDMSPLIHLAAAGHLNLLHEFKLQDAGERAIRDWLVDTLPDVGGPALVIYEDKKVPRLIAREQLANIVVVATTRAVLGFAEERGLIASAEDVWNKIIERAAGANPSLNIQIVQPAARS